MLMMECMEQVWHSIPLDKHSSAVLFYFSVSLFLPFSPLCFYVFIIVFCVVYQVLLSEQWQGCFPNDIASYVYSGDYDPIDSFIISKYVLEHPYLSLS